MNIDQMAHEMALSMQSAEPITDMNLVAALCYQYADAMQAEANKRKPNGLPEVLQKTNSIKDNAPEGATHYREYTGQYVKIENEAMYIWGGSQWCRQHHVYLFNLKPL